MRLRTLSTMVIAAMIAVGAPGAATAAPESSPAAVQAGAKGSEPVQVGGSRTIGAQIIYDVGCWTTFRPPAPGGGPLTHYYANCANSWVWVCPAVDLPGGRITYTASARWLAPYPGVANETNTAVWYYSSTYPNGMYTTTHECS